MGFLSDHLVSAWYRGAGWLRLLAPLEWLYRTAVARRARAYANGNKTTWRAPVPVIVVGNLTVGGTGKSPLVAWLVRWLGERGYRPGILSRGYGGHSPDYPLLVRSDMSVAECGDEPLMLASQTGVPVVVDPQRVRGAKRLLEEGCDVLVADDGLQHLALGRDIELVVVDGVRGFGNRHCLPAGPLREPLSRLQSCDALVVNGEPASAMPATYHTMELIPRHWRHLEDGALLPLTPIPFEGAVHAVAGIGNPERFFRTLKRLGLDVTAHPFPDHHRFQAQDLNFEDTGAIVMTAKDAVKCRHLADTRCWVLDVEAQPEPGFVAWLTSRLALLAQHEPLDSSSFRE